MQITYNEEQIHEVAYSPELFEGRARIGMRDKQLVATHREGCTLLIVEYMRVLCDPGARLGCGTRIMRVCRAFEGS